MWSTVRKFGLGHCDLPTLIWNVAVMLRLVALKVEGTPEAIPKFSYVVIAACAVFYIFNYHVATLCFVFVRCKETGDVVSAILVMSVVTNSLIGVTKLICMYLYQNSVQAMVTGYLFYDTLHPALATRGHLAHTMRSVKKRAILFWSVMMGNGFLYNLHPLFSRSRSVLYDDHVLFGLQMILGTSNYLLVVVSIFTSVTFICYIVSNITGLLIITAGYSEGRMLALSQEIRQLWSDAHLHYRLKFNKDYTDNPGDKKAAKEMNKYVKQRLHVIVNSHAININLVKKLDAIFREAIASEFLLLAISLILDLLGGLEHTFLIIPYVLMQVSMDCYVGQKLMDGSMEFETAVYDCNWEQFDASNMKTVCMLLMMSQKTLRLSAGGVATLGFGCLMVLYKSVYSVYAALQSTVK